ncbi:MAG: hypothetical protein K8T25_19040 [Planctomycetia bacterium]|nr:hypothetical protein [Planctomycetia bacterium]
MTTRMRAMIGLLLCTLLIGGAGWLTAEEPQPNSAAPAPVSFKHASPEAAFEAFRAAALRNEWGTALKSCATKLQDHLIRSNVALGYKIVEGVPARRADFETLLRRHVPTLDAINGDLVAKSKLANRRPELNELAEVVLLAATDKPALLQDLFAWFTRLKIDHGLPASGVIYAELTKLNIHGDTAEAVALTRDEEEKGRDVEFPVTFIRENEGWRLMLPEL